MVVCNPRIFTLILDAGHDLETTDRWGITPLMYAAALGVGEVMKLLIIQGANIVTRATCWNRDFMHYAAVRGHWDLILKSLCTIRLHDGEKAFQQYIYKVILHFVSRNTWLGSKIK
jgi:hypothetical protein